MNLFKKVFSQFQTFGCIIIMNVQKTNCKFAKFDIFPLFAYFWVISGNANIFLSMKKWDDNETSFTQRPNLNDFFVHSKFLYLVIKCEIILLNFLAWRNSWNHSGSEGPNKWGISRILGPPGENWAYPKWPPGKSE